MASSESLNQHFTEMGVEVSNPVLEKCLELCAVYSIGFEEFVETWVSFSLTNLSGATDKPTEEDIAAMERSELSKRREKPVTPQNKPLTVYSNSSSANQDDEVVLNLYCNNITPKSRTSQKRISSQTPTNLSKSFNDNASRRSPGTFSPATYSLTAVTPCEKYQERTNRNKILCSYGELREKSEEIRDLSFSVEPFGDVMPPTTKYMFRQLRDDADILDDTTYSIGMFLIKKYSLPEPVSVNTISHDEFICIGRICCEGESRLNESSLILEGSRTDSFSACIPLQISPGVEYSFFPGQVIAVAGINPNGKTLIANQIYLDASVNLTKELPTFQSSGALQMIVASGPFTFDDSLLYEPLEDMLKYVEDLEPHLFILIGPFVNADHPVFGNDVSFLAASFDEYYEQIMTKLSERFQGKRTKLVIVSSMRDVCSHAVYPTPPSVAYSSIQTVSDPCLLNISNLIVGVSSTDILLHLSKEEISRQMKMDRMTRLVLHLFYQQNFYPLFPPSEDVNLDLELWEDHAQLTVIPHILILPSRLGNFIKFVKGCLVLNPEYLAKGFGGGSFARISVDPAVDGNWSPEKNISAQIIKI